MSYFLPAFVQKVIGITIQRLSNLLLLNKRLLVKAEVRDGEVGNCILHIPILIKSSILRTPVENLNVNSNLHDEEISDQNSSLESIWMDHNSNMNTPIISNCSTVQIAINIAGFIALQLKNNIICENFVQAMNATENIFKIRTLQNKIVMALLIHRKMY